MNNNYYNKSGLIRHLLGYGFDSKDCHKRFTRGENFHLFGGSADTHEAMQEQTLKLIELLGKKGKTIITASDEEFYETASELGMNIFSPYSN